jgi:hypothetical protein
VTAIDTKFTGFDLANHAFLRCRRALKASVPLPQATHSALTKIPLNPSTKEPAPARDHQPPTPEVHH